MTYIVATEFSDQFCSIYHVAYTLEDAERIAQTDLQDGNRGVGVLNTGIVVTPGMRLRRGLAAWL